MSRHAFNEGFADTKHADPLEARDHADFPFEEVFARLDVPTQAEVILELDAQNREQLARALRKIFILCAGNAVEKIGVELSRPEALRRVGLNFVALAWITDPSFFSGSPSLRTLAKQMGFDHKVLSRKTSGLSRTLKIGNRFQAGKHGRHDG